MVKTYQAFDGFSAPPGRVVTIVYINEYNMSFTKQQILFNGLTDNVMLRVNVQKKVSPSGFWLNSPRDTILYIIVIKVLPRPILGAQYQELPWRR